MEQLPTCPIIRTEEYEDRPMAGGTLLQVMPARDTQTTDFEHLATLTEAIKAEELFILPANDVLWCLYHEEGITAYEPQNVEFKCTCSRRRCTDTLKTLPDEEINNTLADEDGIDMHCDHYGNHYISNVMDTAEIRNNVSPVDPQVHQPPRLPQVQGDDTVRHLVPDFYLFTG